MMIFDKPIWTLDPRITDGDTLNNSLKNGFFAGGNRFNSRLNSYDGEQQLHCPPTFSCHFNSCIIKYKLNQNALQYGGVHGQSL
jgi:hypothetical protein